MVPFNFNITPGQFPVNCREVHESLQSGRDFSNWIKTKIDQYGFISGEDFSPTLARSETGRTLTEYYCTYDMAKHLCLVENTERGKLVRKYFIEAERRATTPKTSLEILEEQVKILKSQEMRLSYHEGQINRIEVTNSVATLTSEQVSELDELIHKKCVQLRDMKKAGLIKKKIKNTFFTIPGTRTYKEIPRHGYEEALKIVREYR